MTLIGADEEPTTNDPVFPSVLSGLGALHVGGVPSDPCSHVNVRVELAEYGALTELLEVPAASAGPVDPTTVTSIAVATPSFVHTCAA